MLRIEHLRVGRLPPLSFAIGNGECLAIDGPSGSGKTLLLRAIADLDPADGQVFLDGEERNEMPASLWRRRVRYIAAEPAWWTETPRPAFKLGKTSEGRLERLLGSVGLTQSMLDQQISTLSTGERQRLALVRALVDEPEVILLDEPTAALDPANAALIEELIKFHLLAERCAILVSHDRLQVDRLSHARLLLAPPRARDTAASSRR
jgi:ABC-type iron transport system FetAB ATPase subunit